MPSFDTFRVVEYVGNIEMLELKIKRFFLVDEMFFGANDVLS